MIIRITVGDNDFRDILVSFANTFPYSLLAYTNAECNTTDEIMQMNRRRDYFNKILNPNIDYVLTDEDKNNLIKEIKRKFKIYCETRGIRDETLAYLIKNFKVKIMSILEDKWENGEKVYWLQHSNKVINQ